MELKINLMSEQLARFRDRLEDKLEVAVIKVMESEVFKSERKKIVHYADLGIGNFFA